jgi:hypothetical protein
LLMKFETKQFQSHLFFSHMMKIYFEVAGKTKNKSNVRCLASSPKIEWLTKKRNIPTRTTTTIAATITRASHHWLAGAHAVDGEPRAGREPADVDPNLKYRGTNVEARAGSLRVTVPGTGDAFAERRVVLRHTPAMVMDAGGAAERVYQLKRAVAGFEDMGAARFRVWSSGLNRWAFTFEAANTSAMMDWLHSFEAVGVELQAEWAPDAAADAAAVAARHTLQVEGHADTFDPTRTINSVPRHNSKGNTAPLPPPKAAGAVAPPKASANRRRASPSRALCRRSATDSRR